MYRKFIGFSGVCCPYTLDRVGQRFPGICDVDCAAFCQFFQPSEHDGTGPASVSGDDTMGVLAANGQGGLSQVGSTLIEILRICSQIDGVLHADFRDGETGKARFFIAEVCRIQGGLFLIFLRPAFLLRQIQISVIGTAGFPQVVSSIMRKIDYGSGRNLLQGAD